LKDNLFPKALALEDHPATEIETLSFKKDDIIFILGQENELFKGELAMNGSQGYFSEGESVKILSKKMTPLNGEKLKSSTKEVKDLFITFQKEGHIQKLAKFFGESADDVQEEMKDSDDMMVGQPISEELVQKLRTKLLEAENRAKDFEEKFILTKNNSLQLNQRKWILKEKYGDFRRK